MDVLGLNFPGSIQHKTTTTYPYNSSVASSASSSSSSIFSSDCVSSQSSTTSASLNINEVIWENDQSEDSQTITRGLNISNESTFHCRSATRGSVFKIADAAVPLEMRKNPRRTNSHVSSNGVYASGARPPPALQRQCERKVNFVDKLVDSASQIVEIIWPLSVVASRSDSALGCKGVLPLRTFIQETLRRSRTSYSTLQVALYYLILIKPHVPKHDFTMEQPRCDRPVARAMQCGRRMFLAALILASKYLQDRNYSARAWSKISGLNTLEINQNELMFLDAVNWRLHIPETIYQRWTEVVLKYTPYACGPLVEDEHTWRSVIPKLTPELDTIEIEPASPTSLTGFDMAAIADSPSPASSSNSDCTSNVFSASSEQTPTCAPNLPLTLEPTPRMDCPNPCLPSLSKFGLLPTPQMTPQTTGAFTPAAGTSAGCSRRPSMCAAISQAHHMSMARSTFDQRPPPTFCSKFSTSTDGYPTLTRRSSLARSSSSASSPESMVSDVSSISSRSSRSSSISSCASVVCAASQPRLAVTATRRCAANLVKGCRKNLTIASPIDETSYPGICGSPDTDLNLSNFTLGTPDDLSTSAQEAAQGLCALSGVIPRTTPTVSGDINKRCRKRGRTGSQDGLLQKHVRQLMANPKQDDSTVLADPCMAVSYLLTLPDSKIEDLKAMPNYPCLYSLPSRVYTSQPVPRSPC